MSNVDRNRGRSHAEAEILVIDLATATTVHECRQARQKLNELTAWWNGGRSYPPHVRESLRALNMSVDPACAMRTEEDV